MALLKDMSELDEKGKKGDWCFMSHKTAGEDAFFASYGATILQKTLVFCQSSQVLDT